MLIGDILRQNAYDYPDRTCLVQGDIRLTFTEVERRANGLANGLLKLGLTKGDRLAVISGNCFQYPEIQFAVAKAGIIGVPLNIRLAVPELISYLRYTKPKAIIAAARFADTARTLVAEVPALEHVIGLGEGHPFEHGYEVLIRESSQDVPQVSLSPDDPYMLGATSGTTGIPKGAILTHRQAIMAMLIYYAEIRLPQFFSMLQGIPQFFNPGGPANMLPFLKAGSIIVLPEFSGEAFLEAVQKERPYLSILVPTMLNMVVNHPDVEKYDLSSLKAMTTGGSPIPRTLLQRAIAVLGDIFQTTYGMCESYSCGTILRYGELDPAGPPEKLKRLTSAGHAMVNVEVKVVDEQGQEVVKGSGQAGEIILRGDQMSQAYWEMPEETAASHKDGWFYTGDLATIDEDGYLYIVDRKKDMIISGGINVHSVEVEAAIGLHPSVMQVAVIGVPDPQWGEGIKAFVVLKPGMSATEEDIVRHCREQLASYKKPRSVEFRESLPLSGTGKILKRELREPYWARSGGSIRGVQRLT
ncbi:MAG: AMP-dependent synthetase [Chloroflexota bacterium]|nr:MAG: AMP-dependent synthetase [Chloroflexota bacterium]